MNKFKKLNLWKYLFMSRAIIYNFLMKVFQQENFNFYLLIYLVFYMFCLLMDNIHYWFNVLLFYSILIINKSLTKFNTKFFCLIGVVQMSTMAYTVAEIQSISSICIIRMYLCSRKYVCII